MSKASITDWLTKELELWDGLDELPSIQYIRLFKRLRRCNPGTKLYNNILDKMTKLDNIACEIRSRIVTKLITILERSDRNS